MTSYDFFVVSVLFISIYLISRKQIVVVLKYWVEFVFLWYIVTKILQWFQQMYAEESKWETATEYEGSLKSIPSDKLKNGQIYIMDKIE